MVYTSSTPAPATLSGADFMVSSSESIMPALRLFTTLNLIGAAGVALAAINKCKFPATHIIERDVAIVGGGASGAHAAVLLKEDFGKSIVVVEKQNRLVGPF